MSTFHTRTESEEAQVDITVEPEYLPDMKLPGGEYCFAYHITIHNTGGGTFQLLSRRWEITDGDGTTRLIEGEGVVGKQPRVLPLQSFTYTSFVDLSTPVGTMEGFYTMRLEDDRRFKAAIPCFSLFVPGKVH